MLIIIYSETNQSNILENLGKPEYSYYFVLKEFRPVLERLGRVVEVTRPDDEVDQFYADCLARGEDCVFLSFSLIVPLPTTLARQLRCSPGSSAPFLPKAGRANPGTTGEWSWAQPAWRLPTPASPLKPFVK